MAAADVRDAPAALKLTAITAPQGMRADGADLALVQVEVVDAQGRRNPVALDTVTFDLQGPAAELDDRWTDGYLFSLSGPIYAGTNEIQRNVIAERLLGLPRGDR